MAKSFGHAWAKEKATEGLANAEAIRVAYMAEYMAFHGEDMQWTGIDAPCCVFDGSIKHTTGSGRLRWTILSNAAVIFEVWTRHGELFRITLTSSAMLTISPTLAKPIGLRHIDAAMEAINVVKHHLPVSSRSLALVWGELLVEAGETEETLQAQKQAHLEQLDQAANENFKMCSAQHNIDWHINAYPNSTKEEYLDEIIGQQADQHKMAVTYWDAHINGLRTYKAQYLFQRPLTQQLQLNTCQV